MATDVSTGFQSDQELKSMRAGASDLIRYSSHALASGTISFYNTGVRTMTCGHVTSKNLQTVSLHYA